MAQALQIAALLLLAAAWAFALAHAAELPGKMRLDRETYFAVQAIYYPGFTIGGASEPLAILALAALLAVTPSGEAAFWWTAGALAAAIGAHAAYWLRTHPVNRYWLQEMELSGAGDRFFSAGAGRAADATPDWIRLRDRWEYSHVLRTLLLAGALFALAFALTL